MPIPGPRREDEADANPARSPRPAPRGHWPRRITQLLVGLVLFGAAIALMVRAELGVAPWDVLAQGLSLVTTLSFGTVTVVLGALVLLLWIPLRERPGIGTIANVILIGPSAELTLAIVPTPTELVARVLLFALGLALLAVATGLYVGAGLGAGPRDGLMTGTHRRTGWPIWIIRTTIEVTVVVIGFLLGGTVGLGTLAFALLIGPMVGVTIPWLRVPQAPERTGPARPSRAIRRGRRSPSAPLD